MSKAYKKEYYEKNRRKILDDKKAKRDPVKEHERYLQKKAERLKRFKEAADELYRQTQRQVRISEQRRASWLGSWLADRGIEGSEALMRCGIDALTWDILINGGKTVPGIALIVGASLGVTPDEVAQIGIFPDAKTRRDSEGLPLHLYPWHTDPDWPQRVAGFDADAERVRLYGRGMMRWSSAGDRALMREADRMHDVVTKHQCPICGKWFLAPNSSKTYCSTECRREGARRNHWRNREACSGERGSTTK